MRKLLLVLVAVLLVSGAVVAQNALPEVFCGDLSEADCAILTQSQEAMASLESASFDFLMDMTITGIPEADGPVTFALTGEGAYSSDASVMASMMDMDPSAMQDPAAMMAMAVEALRAFDADLSFTLTLPAALLAETEDLPENITLQLRFVDGVAYLNFDTLAPLFDEADAQLPFEGWLGLDIASLIDALLAQNPEIFDSMNMEMQGFDPSFYAQFSDPTAFSEYATVVRTDDGSGDSATFLMTFDLAALAEDPAFQSLMQEQMEMQGGEFDEEEFAMGMAAAMAMFEDSVLTTTTTIEIATGYQTNTTFSMFVDMSAMVAMLEEMGEDTSDMETAPAFSINVVVNMSDFNAVADITEPEDATVLPYQSLLGMASPGMMGEPALPPVEAEATEEG